MTAELERVYWSDIMQRHTMPPTWFPVGHPHPVPGGALVIFRIKPSRRDLPMTYDVMSWERKSGVLQIVMMGTAPAIYTSSALARSAAEETARLLVEEVS